MRKSKQKIQCSYGIIKTSFLRKTTYSKPLSNLNQVSAFSIDVSRNTNHKVNRLHERALRIVYNDCVSFFQCFQGFIIFSFTIHHQNIQLLGTEIYKSLNDLPGRILKDSLQEEQTTLLRPRINSKSKHGPQREKLF